MANKKGPTGGGKGTNGYKVQGKAKTKPSNDAGRQRSARSAARVASPSQTALSVNIRCRSLAEHAAFVALRDISNLDIETYRIIGGQMVSLHVQRYGLDLPRATADADLGLVPFVLKTDETVTGLKRLGYEKVAGNRYSKNIEEGTTPTSSVIDLLVPSYQTRIRQSVQHGDTNTTEVPGLALAFQQDPIAIEANVEFIGGQHSAFVLQLPNEACALALKVLATKQRQKDRDAIDVWRCLEVCNAAKLTNLEFGSDHKTVTEILSRDFGKDGVGTQAVARAGGLNPVEAQKRATRIEALTKLVLGH